MSFGLGLGLGFGSSGAAAATLTLFADSTRPDDSGNGLSAASAKKTLAAASALVTTGAILDAVFGSSWREQITVAVDQTITSSGAGAIPVIDGADVVGVTWTQPDNVTYPNVWSVSWTRATVSSVGENLGLWVDGVRPRYAASLADLQTNGGWFASALTAQTSTVYVKAATNPTSNGSLYEISRRDHAIYSYDSGKTTSLRGPLELKRAVGHYGSLSMGLGTISQVLLRDGAVHHMVTQGAATTDCIATEIDPSVVGIPFTAYRNAGAGFSHTFTRCLALYPGGASRTNNSGFYCHGSASNPDSVTLNGCVVRGISGADYAVTAASVDGFYCEDPYGYGLNTGFGATIRRGVIRETSGASPKVGGSTAYAMNGGYTAAYVDCAAAVTGPAMGGSNIATITTCSLYAGSSVTGTNLAAAATVTLSVLFGAIQFAAVTGYVGDYNVFVDAGIGFKCNFNGTAYTTLTAWQAATSQDAHSCYATAADQISSNANAFWKGLADGVNAGPTDGDFRINPTARVYNAAGTAFIGTFPDGTRLQLAGAQTFYHHTQRANLSGPPTGWLTLPNTLAEMRTYIQNPAAWIFYAPPTITGTPTTSLTTGTPFSFTPTITAARWPAPVSLAPGSGSLPPGLSLNSTTGVPSGTPTTAGTYAGIVQRITDADGRSSDLALPTLIVTDPPPITERDVLLYGVFVNKAVTDRQELVLNGVYLNEQES